MDHKKLEAKSVQMAILVVILVSIGGLVEIVPLYTVQEQVVSIESVKPYRPLELEGRDIYIREGCYTCHSQAVRPFRDETERYGPYSKAGEYVYDRPFQFGSKRTGPDLHRQGGANLDSWHYLHFRNPRDTSPGSIMPNYPWLYTTKLDTSTTVKKMKVLQQLGTPYSDKDIEKALSQMERDAKRIADRIKTDLKEEVDSEAEVIALIAYMQKLGKDIKWREK
jgi:cytochrome c oxidase cbb3-type subunit I/II